MVVAVVGQLDEPLALLMLAELIELLVHVDSLLANDGLLGWKLLPALNPRDVSVEAVELKDFSSFLSKGLFMELVANVPEALLAPLVFLLLSDITIDLQMLFIIIVCFVYLQILPLSFIHPALF